MSTYHEPDPFKNPEKDFVQRKVRKLGGTHKEKAEKLPNGMFQVCVEIRIKPKSYEPDLQNGFKIMTVCVKGDSERTACVNAWTKMGEELSAYLNPKAVKPSRNNC